MAALDDGYIPINDNPHYYLQKLEGTYRTKETVLGDKRETRFEIMIARDVDELLKSVEAEADPSNIFDYAWNGKFDEIRNELL